MESTVWGEDWGWLADDLIGRVRAAPDEIAVMVAEADGEVVSAARLVLRAGTGFTGLWGGRRCPPGGGGVSTALIAARARLAAARGITYLQVDGVRRQRPYSAPTGPPCRDHHHALCVVVRGTDRLNRMNRSGTGRGLPATSA